MPKSTRRQAHYHQDALFRYARILGFGEIHFKMDAQTGLESIIAIHSTTCGPAIGGCRFYPYRSSGQALKDALRLSYMMTLKAAVSNLPHGGAKSVIMMPPVIKDRKKLFGAFGRFVNEMDGRYITAMDVGTSTEDMDSIAEFTPHVIGAASVDHQQEDPSPYTARGVFNSMRAAIEFRLDKTSFEGLTVAIQGAGKVGYHLAKYLHESGATIIASDINKVATDRFIKDFNATIYPDDTINDAHCDIFSPCAMGGTLNTETIQRIKAPIIIGCANNQLAHRKVANLLHEKGVLYAPDYMVNAGGLIQAAAIHDYHDINIANEQIEQLYSRMHLVFDRAASEHLTTDDIVEKIAREKLNLQAKEEETFA